MNTENAAPQEKVEQTGEEVFLAVLKWLFLAISILPLAACVAAIILSQADEEAAGACVVGVIPLCVLLGCAGIALGACSRLGKSWVLWWGTMISMAPILLLAAVAILAGAAQMLRGN